MKRGSMLLALATASALLAGCSGVASGKGDDRQDKERGGGGGNGQTGGGRVPAVVVGTVQRATLNDRIEAVGTAFANEQASLNSPVTERLTRVNFGDGAFVARGAVIAELARTEEGANLSVTQARLREAELQMQRLAQLQQRGFATKARVDEQQAAVETARAQGNAIRAQIGDRVIRAPFGGWLALRRISAGAIVTAGTPIATIVDYSRIKLDFTVPERLLASVKVGLPVEARAAAFPDERFAGTVSSIDPLVDPVSRAVTVRALLPNRGLKLRPGMLLTVVLEGRARAALVVPELAVLGQGGEAFVYRLDGGDRAIRTTVTTGVKRDGRVEIASGVAAGDRIVIDGTVKVRDGGKVRDAARPRPERRADA